MSAGREAGRQRPRASWLAGRTLSARLIAGVLLLLVGACAIIGLVTYLAIRGSMVAALDGQLRSSSGTYATCIETHHQATTGQDSSSPQPGGDPEDYRPPPNDISCSQGQPQGMLGVRMKNGEITNCSVVDGMSNNRTPVISRAPSVRPDQKASRRLARGRLWSDISQRASARNRRHGRCG